MKITALRITNFLGATGVDVRLDKPVNLFAGRNGAGKSSIRDAVALALTADLGRVGLKKEAAQLITEGQHEADVVVETDAGTMSVMITAAGKIVDSTKGAPVPDALRFAIDAQHFARLDATARRAFLFGLMGLSTGTDAIRTRLAARRCDATKVERIAPMLRAGFDAACKDAKEKATSAKGAWRAVTGETYGSEKAKTWRAPVPAFNEAEAAELATKLKHCDAAVDNWNQHIGGMQVKSDRRASLQAKLPGLRETGGRMARIQTKLDADRKELLRVDAELLAARAAAGSGPRVGLIHDLAQLVSVAMFEKAEDNLAAQDAVDRYEAEFGPLDTTAGDMEAADRVPPLEAAHRLCTSAVANSVRDLDAARRAADEADAIDKELAEPDIGDLHIAQEQAAGVKAEREAVVTRIDALKAVKAQAEAAGKKTKDAAQHGADVAAWDLIADALSPNGIPAEMLAEALEPINERLMHSANTADWLTVGINADMSITTATRPYALLSESEQWRADAMLAEAITHLSGTRLLMLDRFDVLDVQGRGDLIAWLDDLAAEGEIDTALLFGTLKAPPTGLPDTIDAHWLENGVCGLLKAAA